MTPRLTLILASAFDQSDWLKLLGIAGAMVTLYLVAKRLGGGDESYPPTAEDPGKIDLQNQPLEAPAPDSDDVEDSNEFESEAEEASAPERPQPRNIRIANWNFEHFDVLTGPPDPNSFAGELLMDLQDLSTGRSWRQSYLVATPAGLEKMLRSKKWSSMIVPQTLVMSHYDLTELRAAMMEELGATEEERGDVPPDASDTAASGDQ